jgi:hypothetical protein
LTGLFQALLELPLDFLPVVYLEFPFI